MKTSDFSSYCWKNLTLKAFMEPILSYLFKISLYLHSGTSTPAKTLSLSKGCLSLILSVPIILFVCKPANYYNNNYFHHLVALFHPLNLEGSA